MGSRQSSPAETRVAAPPGRFQGDAAEWDGFVRSQPGWTHYHLYGWKDVVERVFGHECCYLADRDGDGQLTGVLPLVRVRSRLFGHYLVSMPFLNYGGPLGSAASVRRLVDHASALARTSNVRLLELRSPTPLDLPLPASHRKVTVILDLPPEPDDLWRGFPAKLRSQVRRPQKEGAATRFGPDQVEPFFRVFARNMRDLGTPTLPPKWFRSIHEKFADQVTVGCVYLNDEPVAAGWGFRWQDELELSWASSLRDYNRIAPNMLLYWSFMERAVQDGVTRFNFGRCTPNGGTHRFKRQWGGRDEPLWWYGLAGDDDATTPTPDGNGAYALGSRIWRRLPLAVATRLGPGIVRFIP